MPKYSVDSDEFAEAAAQAGLLARQRALAAGQPVVFFDSKSERYVQEMPNGRLFEIRFDAEKPREGHVVIVGELAPVCV